MDQSGEGGDDGVAAGRDKQGRRRRLVVGLWDGGVCNVYQLE